MAQLEGSGGGAIGKLWRKHGGGYYALLAVGSFVYMEARSLAGSFTDADGVQDFVKSEMLETLLTFGLETLLNTFLAGIWPVMWIRWMGAPATAAWAMGHSSTLQPE